MQARASVTAASPSASSPGATSQGELLALRLWSDLEIGLLRFWALGNCRCKYVHEFYAISIRFVDCVFGCCNVCFFLGLCDFVWTGAVKQALISLSDKRNLELLAKGLGDLG